MNNSQLNSNANSITRWTKNRLWIVLLVIVIAAGLFYAPFSFKDDKDNTANSTSASRKSGKRGAGPNAITPVVTATASSNDINVYLSGLGSVTPLTTVTIKSRVDGEIKQIYFKEGHMVKSGEVLALIDPRPFEAAFMQAQGQLMRDKALLANTKRDLLRYKTLLQQDSIASQQVDTQEALVQQYEGTVKIDEGLFATAKLNLDYTKVTAPISGRVGLRQVDVGNVIHAADATGFVTITQLQPMSVLFSLPEDSIPDLANKMKGNNGISVVAFDRAFKEKIATGKLISIDNQIDSTTGMVKLRAEFPNHDLSLFPSQFVNAQVLLETKHNVITLPSAGVQSGKMGSFAFVVNNDSTVTQRSITTGTVQGNLTEIKSGLALGDIVVIDGADKLRDGSKVAYTASAAESKKHGTAN